MNRLKMIIKGLGILWVSAAVLMSIGGRLTSHRPKPPTMDADALNRLTAGMWTDAQAKTHSEPVYTYGKTAGVTTWQEELATKRAQQQLREAEQRVQMQEEMRRAAARRKTETWTPTAGGNYISSEGRQIQMGQDGSFTVRPSRVEGYLQ